KLARQWGAAHTFKADAPNLPKKIAAASQWLDAAVLTIPNAPSVTEALRTVRGSGKVLLFAHTRAGEVGETDFSRICLEEKDLIGSYSADFTLQAEVARLVFSRQLDVRPLITHQFPLKSTAAAIALASQPTAASMKVVVNQHLARDIHALKKVQKNPKKTFTTLSGKANMTPDAKKEHIRQKKTAKNG
ncbi:MAG TPA: hypothetical protein VFC44_23955, partial [Candidatus Saccharimonadales bacterium]|nr:hypothetical protein [Candidatus Saccharimonadales bacterium]